jgi:hypothetical protein
MKAPAEKTAAGNFVKNPEGNDSLSCAKYKSKQDSSVWFYACGIGVQQLIKKNPLY